ncbi:MAG TPA: hypothetical protein VLS90_15440, partial [Thermodesulfobacteriota bacterium]|nr:hypothetical protein [Thermodesulfobacteriota bacterium]
LKNPIAFPHEVKPAMEPLGLISPVLDGRVTHFYEWRDAGCFAPKVSGGSMYRGEGFLSAVYFGFDLENIFFRLDPIRRKADRGEGLRFEICFTGPKRARIVFPFSFPPGEKPYFLFSGGGSDGAGETRFHDIAADRIIELCLPFREPGFSPRDKILFFVRVVKGSLEAERYPRSGYLSFSVPDRNFESINWQV